MRERYSMINQHRLMPIKQRHNSSGITCKKNHLQIFTHTEVTSCKETSEGCRLKTKEGSIIQCKYVIIAAGFEAGEFLPKKVMKLTSTYALISHPIDRKDLWTKHCLIWETEEPYIYKD